MKTTDQSRVLSNVESSSERNKKLVEEYISWKTSYTSTAGKAYRLWAERFQSHADKAPEDMTASDFISFAERVKLSHAPKGVEFALIIVHNYLQFFSEQKRIRMPMYLIRVPKAVARSHRPVEEAEYKQMLRHLTGNPSTSTSTRDAAILMLLHDTGMRIGELLSLRVGDVESSESSGVVLSEKSKVLRRVFWSEETDTLLRRHIASRQKAAATISDMLFVAAPRYGTQAYTRRSVARMLSSVASKVGIDSKIVPHSFRHAFVHRLANAGTPDALIAQMVGHSTPTTISHYTKLSRPEMEHIARKQFIALAA